MKQIQLNYFNQDTFTLEIVTEGETSFEGRFVWNAYIKNKLSEIDKLIETNDEF